MLDSLKTVLAQTQEYNKKLVILGDIAEICVLSGDADNYQRSMAQMLQVARESRQDSLLGRAYMQMGSYFSTINEYKQSLEYLFKGLAIAEKTHIVDDIWFANKEIGVTYKELKNYPDAIKYLKKAESVLAKFPKNKIQLPKVRTYSNMAESYLLSGQKDIALNYNYMASQNVSKADDPYGYARIMYLFAKIYQANGDNDLAESYYKKCIDFSKEQNVMLTYVTATKDYGDFLLASNRQAEARQYGLMSYRRAIDNKDKLGIIESSTVLQKAYRALQLKDSSYYFADLKEAYRDSVFSEQQANQIRNLSFVQQLKEKEDEEKRLLAAEERRHRIQYAVIATGIITFFILFLLLSRTLVVNERWISFLSILALLLIFEFINLLIHPFLGNITHHSPALMLLCMVILASMLIPLHHKLEHFIMHKLIEKNKAIRLAAAKRTIEQLDNKAGEETTV